MSTNDKLVCLLMFCCLNRVSCQMSTTTTDFSTLTDELDPERSYRTSTDWKAVEGAVLSDGDQSTTVLTEIQTRHRTPSVTTYPGKSGTDAGLMITSKRDEPDQSASAIYWEETASRHTKYDSQYPGDGNTMTNEASSESQTIYVTDPDFSASSTEIGIRDVTTIEYLTETRTVAEDKNFETTVGILVDAETSTVLPNSFVSTERASTDPENTRLLDATPSNSERLTTELTSIGTDNRLMTSSEENFGTSSAIQPTSGYYEEYSDESRTSSDTDEKSELTSRRIENTRHYTWQSSPTDNELATSIISHSVTSPDPCAGVLCTYGAVCHEGLCHCPPSCRHEVAPVCASNGRTYMSECDMRFHMCVERITLVVIANGPCLQIPYRSLCAGVVCRYGATCINGECICPNACPPVFSPVCGNDGTTYDSECLLKTVACLQKPELRLQYRVACDDISPIIDVVVQESKEKDAFLDDASLLVIYVCVGALISVTLIVVFIVAVVNKRRLNQCDDAAPLTKSAMRTSSSGSRNSQQPQQQKTVSWITIEPRPQHHQPSPCSTPITPQSGFTFTNPELKRSPNKQGIPVRSPLSSTDTSVVEMAPDDDVTIEMPDLGVCTARRAENVKRNAPGRRHTSVTESGVYEIAPEEAAILDDVFRNDDQIVTRL